ncbi:MAG: hypothetical protein ABSB88_21310 [Bryobacteraceae bacterium]|jgi:hypothetical protein
METRGKFRIDPGCLETDGVGGELEVVIPYTEPLVTAEVLRRLPALTAGLNARVSLIAVHTLPYPLPFVCPALVHAHLVEQLTELASGCALPVHPQVVLARDRMEGFRYVLKSSSTVLVGSRRHLWQTQEEKLARSLARDGHKVALIHVE